MIRPPGGFFWRLSGHEAVILQGVTDSPEPVSDLEALIAGLSPEIRPGRFVFVSSGDSAPGDGPKGDYPWLAWVEEPEGPSGVIREENATELGLPFGSVWAWVTLGVPSDLAAVGLTAVVSGALADAGLSCNVIAGLRHDHLLVPHAEVEMAMEALQGLSRMTEGVDAPGRTPGRLT